MDLTDAQWKVVGPLLPTPRVREDGKGRPWRDPRDILNAVFWILRTGAPWADLPDRYPPYQTCHRRFQQWVQEGTIDKLLRAIAQDLRDRGGLDLTESFIDGSFSGAKKGGPASGKPRKARGPRSWQSQTALAFHSPFGLKVLALTK